MNNTNPENAKAEPCQKNSGRIISNATVAGITVVLASGGIVSVLSSAPTWPVAFAVAAIAAMVTVVCYFILK
jgi:fatty acid desaturase